MKNNLFFLFLLLLHSNLSAQQLAGEYVVSGQGGQILLSFQYTADGQLTGTLTDMQGNRYQVEASEEAGVAYGALRNQQGGMYFTAYREGNNLNLTMIPPDANGQPNTSGAQEFTLVYQAGNTGDAPRSAPAEQPGNPLGGPLGGQAATAGNGWSGTFSGNLSGTPATLSLQLSGSQLSGLIDAGGYRYQLSGSVSGAQSQGQLTDPQTQGKLPYSAALNGNQVAVTIQDASTGQSLQLSFTRGTAAAGAPAASPGPGGATANVERDARLVGAWTYTDSYTSGEYSFASQWKMIIYPDGNYVYGDGRVVGGGPGISGDSGGGGDVTRGQWRTENGIVYINTGAGWQAYCRYTTNGQSLLFQFGDGSKQLWKRSN